MSSSKITLDLKFIIDNPKLMETLYKSLKPELEIRLRGVKACIELKEKELLVTIEAPDYSALRAASNSLLRLMSMILTTIDEFST